MLKFDGFRLGVIVAVKRGEPALHSIEVKPQTPRLAGGRNIFAGAMESSIGHGSSSSVRRGFRLSTGRGM
jgi:hypothetical protein